MSSDRPLALITGASGGIGQELVGAFADAGYRVIGTDQAPCPPRLRSERFLEFDLERIAYDRQASERFFTEIRSCLAGAGLTVLVNNAAVQIVKPIEDISSEDVMRTFAVNAVAPFLLARALLPELERAQGSVINISSIHARLTKPGFSVYAASKASLSGLTRALAVEIGRRVRVNAIEPAAIATAMLLDGFGGNQDALDDLSELHPVGRIGQPRDVADLAVFVASDRAKFINGSVYTLDGGISGRLHDPS